MKERDDPEQLKLAIKRFVSYDPISGKLFWNRRVLEDFQEGKIQKRSFIIWNNVNAGKEIFNLDRKGYVRLSIFGKHYLAHRVAWLIYYGDWPKEGLDHKNGIPTDNRIDNLREATKRENSKNCVKTIKTKSGRKGVIKTKNGTWFAQISNAGKKEYLGTYQTRDEAYEVYCSRARELGYTERHLSIPDPIQSA